MNITLTGATGFIGRRLTGELLAAGHKLHVLGRRRSSLLPAEVRFSEWDGTAPPPTDSLTNADAVLHLAGESVAQRWTPEAKALIRNSRFDSTRNLVDRLRNQSRRPQVFICASAIGIYGSRGDEILTETSAPGQGFLADVVKDWESTAQEAESLGVRVTLLRFGMVLGQGGALAKMLTPFRLGVGGRMGSGRQWVSWIHIHDAVRLILFSLDNSAVRGPVNATAPNPVTNVDFTRELAGALHRPALFPVPEFALKLLFGEMSGVILASQRVLPRAAKKAGFQFKFPGLGPALTDILKSGSDAK